MKNFLKNYGSGILLAATGVGAGDLITSGLAGIHFGTSLLWACFFGATLKYFLNEGLARYQMATGETLLTGWMTKISSIIKWPFLIYLLFWTYFVGGALINACAIAATNIFPLTENPNNSKIIYGISHSLLGFFIVTKLNFSKIEKLMSVFIFCMFISVIVTALLIFDVSTLSFTHLLLPKLSAKNLAYSIAVVGGVGGTLTVMSYSYWLQEKNANGISGLRTSRQDLKLSYFLTAIFSMAMIIIGSTIPSFEGAKSKFPVYVSDIFYSNWGEFGRYLFLVGFWCGVFSSLLGVWQSVPYLFADFYYQLKKKHQRNLSKTNAYRHYLIFLAVLPLTTLWFKFEQIQLLYAVIGALFMPLLAFSLLMLTNKKIMGDMKSKLFHNVIYLLTTIAFLYFGYFKLTKS